MITYGGPLTVGSITFNPELASYTLANFRLGLKTGRWQASAYITNIGYNSTHLALDYERGRRARVGYLTNQPRTIFLDRRYATRDLPSPGRGNVFDSRDTALALGQ